MSQPRRPDPQQAAALEAARRRDDEGGMRPFVGRAEFYCEAPSCSVRTVTILIKEYDEPTSPTLRCPHCRRRLKIHHVLTLSEGNERDREAARLSVRRQLYEARHPDAWAIPLMLDSTLPRRHELPAEEEVA
jgi:hypothetical protein